MRDLAVNRELVARLVGVVQNRMVAEAARRSAAGEAPLSSKVQQQAFVGHVLEGELRRIDEQRVQAGEERLSAGVEDDVVERVLADTVGLGPVELFMFDDTIEEVVASRFDLVFLVRSDGTVEQCPDRLWRDEAAMSAWLAHLARTAGRTERQFNAQNPRLVMRVGEGLRLAATRDVSQHVSFALRRNTMRKATGLGDLVARGMFPEVVADLARAWMASGQMRVVVVGATAAGKTTFVRACLGELDRMVRVVIIEDTAEIDLFDDVSHPNVESWEERLPNSEGEGAVGLGDLVKHGLRYRPDWLTVGEVRDSDAAVPMLKAMTHGQASLTTVHANSAVAGLDKLALYLGTGEDRMPLEVAHHQLSQAIDFVVHIDRGVDGRRFVSEVVEVAGFDNARVTTNTSYRAERAGEGHTMHRLTPPHRSMLRRAGFDTDRLGGGWR